MPDVAVIFGSDSDIPKARDCMNMLKDFGVQFETVISSAHRSPDETLNWAKSASERGIKVIIAAAGGAAHLPGVIASHTILPVIGVPIETNISGGLDSIFSILQMPSGIPVAAMAAGKAGAINAAIYAISILALSNEVYAKKLAEFRKELAKNNSDKNKRLQSIGYEEYIKGMEKSK
jgi:5-(carboxyamino)imidazole ribonucleotide mutase